MHDQTAREPVPAIVELDRADRSSEQGLDNIRLPGADGAMVSLRELVIVEHKTIERSIYHKNLRRVVYVTGDVAGADGKPGLRHSEDEQGTRPPHPSRRIHADPL